MAALASTGRGDGLVKATKRAQQERGFELWKEQFLRINLRDNDRHKNRGSLKDDVFSLVGGAMDGRDFCISINRGRGIVFYCRKSDESL
jgi:hypothetical protein